VDATVNVWEGCTKVKEAVGIAPIRAVF
jgi:hypothetical protein